MDSGVFFPQVKWPELEADHLPSPGVQFQNGGANSPTPPDVLRVWCLIKQAQGQLYSKLFLDSDNYAVPYIPLKVRHCQVVT
jgi:hypothetical protein